MAIIRHVAPLGSAKRGLYQEGDGSVKRGLPAGFPDSTRIHGLLFPSRTWICHARGTVTPCPSRIRDLPPCPGSPLFKRFITVLRCSSFSWPASGLEH